MDHKDLDNYIKNSSISALMNLLDLVLDEMKKREKELKKLEVEITKSFYH